MLVNLLGRNNLQWAAGADLLCPADFFLLVFSRKLLRYVRLIA